MKGRRVALHTRRFIADACCISEKEDDPEISSEVLEVDGEKIVIEKQDDEGDAPATGRRTHDLGTDV